MKCQVWVEFGFVVVFFCLFLVLLCCGGSKNYSHLRCELLLNSCCSHFVHIVLDLNMCPLIATMRQIFIRGCKSLHSEVLFNCEGLPLNGR